MKDLVVFLDVRTCGSEALYYEAARCLGLTPVVISQWPWNYVGVPAANRHWTPSLSPKAILPILNQIGRERIAGFIATTSERVELAARLSLELGRPHPDLNAISICNNKWKFRHFLQSNGIATVEFQKVRNASEAYDAAKSLGGQAVIKPLTGTGSRYVRVCLTPEEAYEQARLLLKRKNKELLVEKFISFPHYSVDVFNTKSLLIHRNIIQDGTYPIICGSDAPAPLTPDQYSNIAAFVETIVGKIGLNTGPALVELRFDGKNMYLIEINPRPGLLSPLSINGALGIDLAEQCVRFSCGIPLTADFPAGQNEHFGSSIRHLVASRGGVRAVHGIDEALKVPYVKKVEIFKGLFTRFGKAVSNTDRIGYVHSVADNVNDAIRSAEQAISELKIDQQNKLLMYMRYRMAKIRYRNLKLWYYLRNNTKIFTKNR